MATLSDFEKIAEIEGVKSYVLVKNDGRIVCHNSANHVPLALMVLNCGINCDTIKGPRFKYLVFFRENRENFFIFPVGNYYLGLQQQADLDAGLIADKIVSFIQSLTKKRRPKPEIA